MATDWLGWNVTCAKTHFRSDGQSAVWKGFRSSAKLKSLGRSAQAPLQVDNCAIEGYFKNHLTNQCGCTAICSTLNNNNKHTGSFVCRPHLPSVFQILRIRY